ncbi:hypothetical protein Lal_00032205 [Lupinus albus]|nr:hypothetical protein Lal_00032205 [Lupinus albus]
MTDYCCCVVGMRKDPKVGGGEGGTCKVTKNQNQHSPRVASKFIPNFFNVDLSAARNLWYLDSGCSKHMTGDKSKFSVLTPRDKDYVTYDDNKREKFLESRHQGQTLLGNDSGGVGRIHPIHGTLSVLVAQVVVG